MMFVLAFAKKITPDVVQAHVKNVRPLTLAQSHLVTLQGSPVVSLQKEHVPALQKNGLLLLRQDDNLSPARYKFGSRTGLILSGAHTGHIVQLFDDFAVLGRTVRKKPSWVFENAAALLKNYNNEIVHQPYRFLIIEATNIIKKYGYSAALIAELSNLGVLSGVDTDTMRKNLT